LSIIKVSAPGSLILMGEHAVLYGYNAIICSINKRIHVSLTPVNENIISIFSIVGNISFHKSLFIKHEKLKFVIEIIKYYQHRLPSGCKIIINSSFNHMWGLGSSGAINVAMIQALHIWLKLPYDKYTIFSIAKKIMLSIQGVGSGADIAASIFGGLLLYNIRKKPKRLKYIPKICAVYSGYKTTTYDVIKLISKKMKINKKYFYNIYENIGNLVNLATIAIQNKDFLLLAKYMQDNQIYLNLLGINDLVLNFIIQKLLFQKNIYAAKISGSGLGDCIIGLGSISNNIKWNKYPNILKLNITIDTNGIINHK
jgi:mevalonate kinase